MARRSVVFRLALQDLAIEKVHFQSRRCRHFPAERDRRGKTRFARLFGTGVRSRGHRAFARFYWENALALAVLVVFVLCMTPVREGHSAPAAEDAAVSQPEHAGAAAGSDAAEHDVWDSLFQNRLQSLNMIMSQVDAETANLTGLLSGFKADVDALSLQYQQLAALVQISRSLPMELGVLLDQLQRLHDRLNAVSTPLNRLLALANANLGKMSRLENSLNQGDQVVAGSPLAETYLERIAEARKRLSLLQDRLTYALAPAREIEDEITRTRSGISAGLPALWKAYYLSPSEKLFEPEGWLRVGDAVKTFDQTFFLRLHAQFPQSGVELARVAARLATMLAFLWGGTLFSRRFVRGLDPEWRNGLDRMARHSLPWIFSGIALFVAAWAPKGAPYQVLIVCATFLLSVGQMALAWDIRTFAHPELPLRSPLTALFVPLFGGLLLLFFNLPPEPLGAIWICILLGSLWYEHRFAPPDAFPLETGLLRAHKVVLWVLLAATLFGWGRLSILGCMAFAMLAICIQQGVAFVRLSNVISARIPQSGLGGLLTGMLLALCVPVLLVIFTLSMGMWTLAYPGGVYLLDQMGRLDIHLGKRSLTIVQLLLIISAFYITRSAISVGRLFLRRLNQFGRFDPALISPLQTGYAYFLWGLFVLYVLSSLGFSLTSLAVVAGGLSVGVGFGMQSIINNFVSGLLLLFGQNLREGDIIEVGGIMGTVSRVDIRVTEVETFDSSIIFIPNGTLLTTNLTNWTRNGHAVRRVVNVGVAYGSDVPLVIRLLREIADRHPRVLKHPEPSVLFTQFGDSTLNFVLRVWLPDILHETTVLSDLHVQINEVFGAHGIVIAFAQLDVHFPDGFPPIPQQPGEVSSGVAAPLAGVSPASSTPADDDLSITEPAFDPSADGTPMEPPSPDADAADAP